MTEKRKPNILYIMADQLAAPQLKMYNSKSQIKTPNLDALAEKAVVFDSAYTPSPLCAPSRMSMCTGQLPTKIGSYDNAAEIAAATPTYAHYLRAAGYETTLAGKMHFIGDQLHGYESRLTSDIYPADFGWVVDWDEPERRLEWYHNASSILQAGPCVRSNQLDYDEEDVEIDLPVVSAIPQESQDPHSKRLLKVCDLWDKEFTTEQIKRAKRAYYGSVSYVDDCIGRILKASARVPLFVHYPALFAPHHVTENVSTLDLLPTLVDLVGTKLIPSLPMDGLSLLPHLQGIEGGHDTVFAEYCGEGTIAPLVMIRRGAWKYIHSPADPDQLFNLSTDPLELTNLAVSTVNQDPVTQAVLFDFQQEAQKKWDFKQITQDALISQRMRRFVWGALKTGKFTSWDFNPLDDGREKYIRSHMPLDDLELRARYPAVDDNGREK
eukprot:gene27039-33700_t